MKRLGRVTAACAAAAAMAVAVPGLPEEPADGLIVDAMSAPQTLAYDGTVEVVQIGDSHSEASVYRIEHRPPDLTRRVYLSPPHLQGTAVVSRGDDTYFIDQQHHRIVHTVNTSPDDRIARDGNYLLMRANYQAQKRDMETFDGRSVRDVTLVNKYTGRPTMLLRIDEETHLILDKQQFAPNGAMTSEVRFEAVRYSTPLPPGDFDLPRAYPHVEGPRFTGLSPNVLQLAQSSGLGAHAPKALPDGFAPVGGRMLERDGNRTVHLLYSDGIRTVSLFQTAAAAAPDFATLHPKPTTIGGHDAQYALRGPMTLLSWTDGSLRCTLVGELMLDELQRIAAAIH